MTNKVLVVQDDLDVDDLIENYDDLFSYLPCEHCGVSDGLEITSEVKIDQMFACYTCGATSRVCVDEDDNLYSIVEHCRHNRPLEVDCMNCEIEGIDLPR